MKRVILVLALFSLAMVAVIPAFGSEKSYPLRISDDWGRQLTISREPQRIISLAPSNTELLFALGVGSRIAGVTNYCNYPEAALKITRVGDMNLNYEALLALRPDLVLAVGSMQKNAIARLETMGMTVLVLEAGKMADVPRHLRLLGKVLNVPASGENLAATFERRMAGVAQKVSSWKRRPRVFVEIWNEPLMSAGPGTYIDELIRLAGGENIAGDAQSQWPQFSQELVIKRDPEAILLTCQNKAEVLARATWRGVSAIKNGRVYEVNQDIYVRPGPRLADALEELAGWLALIQ